MFKCKECSYETLKGYSLGAHVANKHRLRKKLKQVKVTKNC